MQNLDMVVCLPRPLLNVVKYISKLSKSRARAWLINDQKKWEFASSYCDTIAKRSVYDLKEGFLSAEIVLNMDIIKNLNFFVFPVDLPGRMGRMASLSLAQLTTTATKETLFNNSDQPCRGSLCGRLSGDLVTIRNIVHEAEFMKLCAMSQN